MAIRKDLDDMLNNLKGGKPLDLPKTPAPTQKTASKPSDNDNIENMSVDDLLSSLNKPKKSAPTFLERLRAEEEQRKAEKAEQERIATEKAAAEKAERERIAAEKVAAEKAERERIAAEKAEEARRAAEIAAIEEEERRRIAEENAAAVEAERKRLAAERAAAEEKAALEQLAAIDAEIDDDIDDDIEEIINENFRSLELDLAKEDEDDIFGEISIPEETVEEATEEVTAEENKAEDDEKPEAEDAPEEDDEAEKDPEEEKTETDEDKKQDDEEESDPVQNLMDMIRGDAQKAVEELEKSAEEREKESEKSEDADEKAENDNAEDDKADTEEEKKDSEDEADGEDQSDGEKKKRKGLTAALKSILDEDADEIIASRSENPEDDGEKPKKGSFKKVFYAVFGVIFAVLACVGLVTVIIKAKGMFSSYTSGDTRKDALEKAIYPAVIMDIESFADPTELPSEQVLTAAIWSMLMTDGAIDKYEKIFDVVMIPSIDVESYAVKLFGENLPPLTHTNVGPADARFYYNEETKTYNVPVAPVTHTYSPEVKEATKSGNDYTVVVDYIDELPSWLPKTSSKSVEFVLTETNDGYLLRSMKILTTNTNAV